MSTAWLLAMLNNVNTIAKRDKKSPADFDIFAERKAREIIPLATQLAAIKAFFV